MKLAHFAKAINTVPRNVYLIFQRTDIKLSQLKKIGKVLNYDFMQYYLEKPAEPLIEKKNGVHVTFYLDGTEENYEEALHILRSVNELLKKKK